MTVALNPDCPLCAGNGLLPLQIAVRELADIPEFKRLDALNQRALELHGPYAPFCCQLCDSGKIEEHRST